MRYYDDDDNDSVQDSLRQENPPQDTSPNEHSDPEKPWWDTESARGTEPSQNTESSQDRDPSNGWQSHDEYQPGSYSRKERRAPLPHQKNNMALASMICGLTGTILIFCCFAFPASILLGAAAIVLSFMSRKGGPFTGVAVAGLVFGILAVLLGIAECAYLIFVSQMLRDPEMARIFDQLLEQYGVKPGQ